VLLVGGIGVNGHRTVPERRDEAAHHLPLGLRVLPRFLTQPLLQQTADSPTHKRVRHEPTLDHFYQYCLNTVRFHIDNITVLKPLPPRAGPVPP
jgi:hypothetical protein